MPTLLLFAAQAEAVVETPATAFLKAGLMGAAVVALGIVVVYLWIDGKKERKDLLEQLKNLQERRVADAQAVTAQLLETNEQCVSALTNVTHTLETQREAMTGLKDAVENLANRTRR